MKRLLLLAAVMALVMPAANIKPAGAQEATAPAAHAEHAHETPESGWLKHVEARYVCMMNNAVFEKEQMAIEIDGKTYYGCCAMCKERLAKDISVRQAIDPVSGNTVDKATAVIGEHHGMVYYFENEESFQKFASGPMPQMHGHMEGMTPDHGTGDESQVPAAPENHEDHH